MKTYGLYKENTASVDATNFDQVAITAVRFGDRAEARLARYANIDGLVEMKHLLRAS